VKDTGIGISQPDLGKLFQVLLTGKDCISCCSATLIEFVLRVMVRMRVPCLGFVANGGPDERPTRLIRFSVKDTGIGISQPDLGKLFKSFSQVRVKLCLLFVHSLALCGHVFPCLL
jgi:signal transduction histidine kinase